MPNLWCSFDINSSGASGNEGKSKKTWKTSHKIVHSLMVHARVLEVYINFSLMYMTDNIFTVLPIKDLINKDVDPTTPYNMLLTEL